MKAMLGFVVVMGPVLPAIRRGGAPLPPGDPERGGFRMQRCGCDSYCTGKVEEAFYDAAGAQKPCAEPKEECEPPPATAAFQDACTERGFHLRACACDEWLCSGNPTK